MILITGATSGIGEATARAFAKEKKNLLLSGRRADRLEAIARELSREHGIEARTLTLDVTDRSAIEALDPALLSEVEVLVNNAGLAKGMQPIQTGALDDWEAMIDTNFKGLLWMSRAVLPYLIRKKSGHIINIGSVARGWSKPSSAWFAWATKVKQSQFTRE
jgi:3-hydroxy acid dehydrogenase/malonic semialdehyde reductase